MTHDCYYEVEADTPHEMGLQLGKIFGGAVRNGLNHVPALNGEQRAFANTCLAELKTRFPAYAAELAGCAEGAGIALEDYWLVLMEDDVKLIAGAPAAPAKCTTMVTNDGRLVAHNEDWDRHSMHRVFVLRRRLAGVEKLELHYAGTLGGNSAGINSHGVVQSINSLPAPPVPHEKGLLPCNVAARFMSDTDNPERDLETLRELPLLAGYSHTLVDTKRGAAFHAEGSSVGVSVRRLDAFPFGHANHFIHEKLAHLNDLIDEDDRLHDKRYDYACTARPQMSVTEVNDFMADTSAGPEHSVLNNRTLGRVVIDMDAGKAHFWMLREEDKGFITYDLPAIA